MSLLEHFVWPGAAFLLLLAPSLWLASWWAEAVAARRLRRTLGARSQRLAAELGRGHRRGRRALATTGCAAAVVALMQPLVGEGEPVEQRGVDIVVCLDLSRSMQARDLPPTRLGRAQAELRALAERARGDRLALVVFAGEARTFVPLTLDVDSFATLAGQVHTFPALRPGTDLGQALDVALGALVGPAGGQETILLLTDGEDHAGAGLRAAQRCAERGVPVHCVGFGSELGSKIAVGEPGAESWLRDRTGQDVVSAVDVEGLRRIAGAAGGEMVLASPEGGTLVSLYDRHVRPMARKALATARQQARANRFQWPLGLALLAWIAELALTERRRERPRARGLAFAPANASLRLTGS